MCEAAVLLYAGGMAKKRNKRTRSKDVTKAEIESEIFVLRGHRVMLDADLAQLYEVTTAALNQAVKRNPDRFPDDFAFQLT